MSTRAASRGYPCRAHDDIQVRAIRPTAITGMTFKTTLDRFCWWLEQTDWSQAIQSTPWVVPAVQTVHILAIATVLGAVLMINLRLLGLAGVDQPLARQSQRYLPVIWWTLPVLNRHDRR